MTKKKNGKVKTFFLKHKFRVILTIFAIALVGVCTQVKAQDQSVGKTFSSATLMKAIDIQELSTSQFDYNGIANIYRDNKKEKIKCYVRYEATVKAGINMDDINIETDNENKKVYITLPKIQIYKPNVDEKSFSYIKKNSVFDRKELELKDVISACIKDAKKEAKKSTELKNTAKENLKSIIEGLINPIIKEEGYTIEWKES